MLTTLAIALCFIVLAFLAAALPSALMRRRYGHAQPAETRELGREVTARIGVLHGLILGLVFGQVVAQDTELRNGIQAEAAAVEQVWYNAAQYGGAPELQRAAEAYMHAVVERDWPRQRVDSQVSDEGWRAWRAMQSASLALDPSGRRQTVVAASIHAQVQLIQHLRQVRGYHTAMLPFEFWFAAITGLVLIGAVMFVHQADRKHLALVGAYSTYAGLVLFMIWDLSQPYRGLIGIGPDAFVQALDSIRSGI